MQEEELDFAKEIYEYYNRKRIFLYRGVYPKHIKNWDKIINSDIWKYIVKFAEKIKYSGDLINYKVYIDALFNFSDNKWVEPELLISPKGIAIYKAYITDYNNNNSKEAIKKSLIISIKKVYQWCKLNNVHSFEEYFYYGKNTFPIVLKHLHAGLISKHFFNLIPNVENLILNFPRDIILDLLGEKYKQNILAQKALILSKDKWFIKFQNNFESLLNNKLNHYFNNAKIET